jgi:dTDP-4-dehydrorhamnose reductase
MFLIVGGDGTLGTALQSTPERPEVVAATSRREQLLTYRVDLADSPDTWRLPDEIAGAVLCAAITSIDTCERDPAGTRAINVTATVELARRIRERGGHCVFLSTNQVFDGTRPFRKEDEPPCPLSEYGRQKAEAEAELLTAGHGVVRLTKVFGSAPKLFRGWREQLRSSQTVHPFEDMVFAPVGVKIAAASIWEFGVARVNGVVHLSADADVAYSTVARRLAARMGVPADLVQPTTVAAAGLTAAAVPRHTTLAMTRWPAPSALEVADALIEDTCNG